MRASVRRCKAVVSVVCLLLAYHGSVICQQQTVRVTGAIVRENIGPGDGMVAELCDPLGDRVVSRAMVSPAGEFAFDEVPAGPYKLRIAAGGGGILAQRLVSADAGATPLEIRLEGTSAGAAAPGKVSLARLQHRVPPRAAREFDREGRAFQGGDTEGSVAHLRKALEIDPDYMEAHNNLGARYMALNRFEDAAAEFHRAIELDPAAEKAFANLAGALLLLGRVREAEAAARRAVALDPEHFQGHYLLGRVLVAEGKDREEAARELDRAAALRK